MKKILLVCAALLLTACGNGSSQALSRGESTAIAGQSVTILEGSDLHPSGEGLSGTGAVLVDTALDDAREGQSYAVDFALADGGGLILVSHSDVELENGFSLKFVREGSHLSVTLEAGGREVEARGTFQFVDASQLMKLQIDVHNDKNPAQIMIWNRLFARNFTPANLLFNSGSGSPGFGQGTRWGFFLKDATVNLARPSRPKSQG